MKNNIIKIMFKKLANINFLLYNNNFMNNYTIYIKLILTSFLKKIKELKLALYFFQLVFW